MNFLSIFQFIMNQLEKKLKNNFMKAQRMYENIETLMLFRLLIDIKIEIIADPEL